MDLKQSRKKHSSSLLKKNLRKFYNNRLAMVGLVCMLVILFACIFAPLITTFDPKKPDFGAKNAAPSLVHLFGTDNLGRDLFARILYGGRISILVGVVGAHAAQRLLVRQMLHHTDALPAGIGKGLPFRAGGHQDLVRVLLAQGELIAPQIDLDGVAQRGHFADLHFHALGNAHVHDPALYRALAMKLYYLDGIADVCLPKCFHSSLLLLSR